MREDSARFWEFAVKVVGTVTVLAAAFLSYSQYVDTADRESRKPLLTKRLELCIELADAAEVGDAVGLQVTASVGAERGQVGDRAARAITQDAIDGRSVETDRQQLAAGRQVHVEAAEAADGRLRHRVEAIARDLASEGGCRHQNQR